MTPGDSIDSGEDGPRLPIAAKMEAIAAQIDREVRERLADYVNQDGWLEDGRPHTDESFNLVRVTVGQGHLMAIQWRFRSREDNYPSYPELSLERWRESDVVLRLWAPSGDAHPRRLELGRVLHSATGLRVEMYGDFMLSKDPARVEAWRAYRTCDARIP